MPRFDVRASGEEIMDNLDCSGQVVFQTLRELEVINRLLGGNPVTIDGIQHLIKSHPARDCYSVADLGCGGGDILKLVAHWGKRHNIGLTLTGIDANPNIITFAAEHTKSDFNIHYETLNIMAPEFKQRKFDIVLATLFTHHFTDHELTGLFSGLKEQALLGVVVNDIHRHWFAYHSIRILTRLFSKSSMVRYDAPLSVLRAFRRNELEGILEKAGIKKYRLKWRWAFRWQLIIPSSAF